MGINLCSLVLLTSDYIHMYICTIHIDEHCTCARPHNRRSWVRILPGYKSLGFYISILSLGNLKRIVVVYLKKTNDENYKNSNLVNDDIVLNGNGNLSVSKHEHIFGYL
jgi:hypothetical protein